MAAFDHGAGAPLGYVAINATSNEIPVFRALPIQFDLRGATVTGGAMRAQIDTVEVNRGRGDDCAFTAKWNAPTLRHEFEGLPWKYVLITRQVGCPQGQRVTRAIRSVHGPNWTEFPSAQRIAQLRPTGAKNREKTAATAYLITSAGYVGAPPGGRAAWAQDHRDITNRQHYVLDFPYLEDRSIVCTNLVPRAMTTLRNVVIGSRREAGWVNIAATTRRHRARPERAPAIVST